MSDEPLPPEWVNDKPLSAALPTSPDFIDRLRGEWANYFTDAEADSTHAIIEQQRNQILYLRFLAGLDEHGIPIEVDAEEDDGTPFAELQRRASGPDVGKRRKWFGRGR